MNWTTQARRGSYLLALLILVAILLLPTSSSLLARTFSSISGFVLRASSVDLARSKTYSITP